MILPTELLKKMVDDIVELDTSSTVQMKFMLRNRQDPEFKIDDGIITYFTITCDHSNNVTDDIQLGLDVQTQHIPKIIEAQSDMYADILIEYVNARTYVILLDEEPIQLKYNVFIHDLSGLTKKYGVNMFEDVESQSEKNTKHIAYAQVEMQLISEVEHKANKSAFSGVLTDINVEDTIKYVASMMGVSQVKMTPADNTTKYKHMTIPPDKGSFKEVFGYLQSKYGVYVNGFRHYITNGVLYVYPPFDLKSEKPKKLKVIRISENTYMGCPNYHRIEENGDITIITNTKLESMTLSNVSSENEGNAKLFIRSDGMLDGQVDKSGDMKLKNMSANMSSKSDSTITKDSAVPKYVGSTMNLYGHASTFAESNGELLMFGWQNARIDLLEPGMPVVFIYDEKDIVMEKKGILESVVYTFNKIERLTFACLALLTIRSDPNPVPHSQ